MYIILMLKIYSSKNETLDFNYGLTIILNIDNYQPRITNEGMWDLSHIIIYGQ